MNELSRRVLRSIEAAFVAEKDYGKCLHQVLCENNKATRHRADNQKIWVPFWGCDKFISNFIFHKELSKRYLCFYFSSLGMSWFVSRLIPNQSVSTTILESLKASAMGLGGAECDKNFQCDMKVIHSERKRRRRKRSAEKYVFQWNI